ncbi:MAG TPA: hypothetical protein VJ547_09025 [Candidatus Thermoplasmatota archaeon]|nr:hypothetical protein [Candidatus Thermoplasmatota archaeon]
MSGDGGSAPSPPKADGARLESLEEEARIADLRLRRLEAASAAMKGDVEMLAEAAGGLRQQSAKMREAALRVAELVQLAARRKNALRQRRGSKAR